MPSATTHPSPDGAPAAPSVETTAVLLVEDSDTHAALVDALLSGRGDAPGDGFGRFDLTRTVNAGDALAILAGSREGRFDVVLLDLTLPDSVGLATYERVAAATSTPVIVMTGSDDMALARRCVESGAQDFLVKQATSGDVLVRSIAFGIQRSRMQSALEQALRERDEATRRTVEFVSMASHELLSPLTTIKGFSDLLSRQFDDLPEAQRREMVGVLRDRAARAVTDATLFLDAARLQDGVLCPACDDVPIGSVVAEAAEAADVDVRVAGGGVARVDRGHVRAVLVNLLSNARKYGSAPYEVTIAAEGEDVLVEVRDHGEGVPDDFVAHLFTSYARAGDTEVAGTGLGLSIARRLAEANEGSLVHRHADPGAVFALRLPGSVR